MAKQLGYYIDPIAASGLFEIAGANLEHLTKGDKAALLGIVGLYLQGKHDELEEWEDSEPWTELNDGWQEYPLVASGRVQDIVMHVLNHADDRTLLRFVTALTEHLWEECHP